MEIPGSVSIDKFITLRLQPGSFRDNDLREREKPNLITKPALKNIKFLEIQRLFGNVFGKGEKNL